MPRRVARTLVETLIVVAVGAATGLAANALSAKPLQLGRNFFAAPRPPRPAGDTNVASDRPAPPTKATLGEMADGASKSPTERLTAELLADGWQVVDHEAVVNHFHSPEFQEQRVVFVDARVDAVYLEGHIPGAYQLDHYRIDYYLPDVLPICEYADTIVVYCNGGECEDSKLAAGDLIDAGVLPSRVHIYLGGIVAWKAASLPLERGARGSEDLVSSEAP